MAPFRYDMRNVSAAIIAIESEEPNTNPSQELSAIYRRLIELDPTFEKIVNHHPELSLEDWKAYKNAKPDALGPYSDFVEQGFALRAHVHSILKPTDSRLLKLPFELLDQIASHVDTVSAQESDFTWSQPHKRRKVDIDALKSLRLTCRHLCEVASPYLVPTVTVHVTQKSLDRLNAISRHTSIGRGVRCIRIPLGFYDGLAAYAQSNFILMAKQRLEDLFERDLWHGMTHRDLLSDGAKEKLQSIFQLLDRFINSQPWDQELSDQFHEGLFGKAYDKYARLEAEQKHLHDDRWHSYSDTVSFAMKRMPNATRLEMSDTFEPRWTPPEGDALVNDDELYQFLITPYRWEHAATGVDELEDDLISARRPLGFIPGVLGAINVSLTRFAVRVTPMHVWTAFDTVTDEMTMDQYARVIQRLRCLDFTSKYILSDGTHRRPQATWPKFDDPADFEGCGKFLSVLTMTDSIERISIDLEEFKRDADTVEIGAQEPWHLNWLIQTHPWPNLHRLTLSNVRLSSHDLGVLLGVREIELSLGSVEMVQGTWEETLDMLRRKTNPKQRGEQGLAPLRIMALTGLSGAECNEMGEDECRVLGIAAQGYVWHLQENNPFRWRPEE
ncbi:hypothetical protein CORC01_07611 [Colletotrichum orchidophilum]|uniref:Uncharacterized protein n=1 Tax=Colletotrichum orchidophilum TaxID=1209926 RepID=A0A1G4B6U6_9PEZI|nr:uncharacterized protein CORC01_07611 [Colletotrichum orchidophilum]OHE97170.1 hypothetical protein CORC01_07611 [Colletotrichum orchidophilum]